MHRITIRRTLQSSGKELFNKMHEANPDLGNIAGEFIRLNEEYVLNHQNLDETFMAADILINGFSQNQTKFLERLVHTLSDNMEDTNAR